MPADVATPMLIRSDRVVLFLAGCLGAAGRWVEAIPADRRRLWVPVALAAIPASHSTRASDARGAFRMQVPAQEVIRIATVPDADGGVTIMTGNDATFLGGCLRH